MTKKESTEIMVGGAKPHFMENKKLIRIVESFVVLPIMATSLSFGSIPDNMQTIAVSPQILLAQKENIEAGGLFSLNKEEDEKAKLEAELDLIRQAKADAIDSYFAKRKAPLEGMGMKMVLEAEKNDLDWRLIPAISIIESTGGKFACKRVTYSFLGWGSCKINFESNEKAIEIVAWNLGGNNPNTDQYYAGKTTTEILKKYNSFISTYAQKVIKIMNTIGDEDLSIDPIHSLQG
ncbi:MAG: hypothetical protein UU24_C0010G0006 [Candidatus Nomurabacteria bacterium GW2011_GWA2_40_9]|uniref:Mannosyl-glycoprotein endo-beta-N-acetylglucosamidase-like domain-containing protein n=1 Tax=Candidatus Nomurabacteria bacterium GW2011_GWA2_40_9 TaxID=1618734 RepID=A0A0G0WVC7_9BACT|nr:MAG: hypothetical protein UU24_C0010G0006 [Candidatus Nomurabacteria bacterium GW2011_GWA2_40_9]